MSRNPNQNRNGSIIDAGVILAAFILFAALGIYIAVDAALSRYGVCARLTGDCFMAGLALLAVIVQELQDRARLRALIRQYGGQ